MLVPHVYSPVATLAAAVVVLSVVGLIDLRPAWRITVAGWAQGRGRLAGLTGLYWGLLWGLTFGAVNGVLIGLVSAAVCEGLMKSWVSAKRTPN